MFFMLYSRRVFDAVSKIYILIHIQYLMCAWLQIALLATDTWVLIASTLSNPRKSEVNPPLLETDTIYTAPLLVYLLIHQRAHPKFNCLHYFTQFWTDWLCNALHDVCAHSYDWYALLTLTPSLLKSVISSFYERIQCARFTLWKANRKILHYVWHCSKFSLSRHLTRGRLGFWCWLCLLSIVCTMFTCSLLFSCFSKARWMKFFVPI